MTLKNMDDLHKCILIYAAVTEI